MIVGAPGSAILAAAQQAQAQQGRGLRGPAELPDAAAAAARAAVDGRGPTLAPQTAIQAQAAEEEQDGPADDVARRIFDADTKDDERNALTEKGADGLTPAEERQVQALQRQDAAVRRHEQAHAAAGGAYAGAPRYQYTTGPDGRRYAIGGEVSIDAGVVRGNPEATIAKLQAVKRAALAPTDPSPQDRRVAAQADLGIAQARVELREARAEEARERREETDAVEDGTSPGADAQGPLAGDDAAPAEAGPPGFSDGRGAATARASETPGPAPSREATPAEAANGGALPAISERLQGRAVSPGAVLDLVV